MNSVRVSGAVFSREKPISQNAKSSRKNKSGYSFILEFSIYFLLDKWEGKNVGVQYANVSEESRVHGDVE